MERKTTFQSKLNVLSISLSFLNGCFLPQIFIADSWPKNKFVIQKRFNPHRNKKLSCMISHGRPFTVRSTNWQALKGRNNLTRKIPKRARLEHLLCSLWLPVLIVSLQRYSILNGILRLWLDHLLSWAKASQLLLKGVLQDIYKNYIFIRKYIF